MSRKDNFRKRKSTNKDEDSTEELSSEDNSSEGPSIKRTKKTSSKDKTSFPTVSSDLCKNLLSKISGKDREKFKNNAECIEELFGKIWASNKSRTGYKVPEHLRGIKNQRRL